MCAYTYIIYIYIYIHTIRTTFPHLFEFGSFPQISRLVPQGHGAQREFLGGPRLLLRHSGAWTEGNAGRLPSHGGTAIAGWFLGKTPNLKWMMTGGSPIYGNLQMGIPRDLETKVGSHTHGFGFLAIITGTLRV